MYKVILFDLDGTLTESGEGITKSVQYALEKLGKPEDDLKKLEVFVGPPLLQQFMEYAGLDEETGIKAVEYYRERYSTVGIFENQPYPGVEEMLDTLCQKGYTLAVASSKPEYFVKKILDHFASHNFTEISGQSEMIQEVLARLNMQNHRDEVIMVGDKEHDVFGARKAGIECVAVAYGYGTEQELKQAQPLKIVDSVQGIVDFFC